MPANTPKSRILSLGERSIVVYKKPKGMSDDEFAAFIYQAANDILARFGISTIVVGVESWDEIMVLDEQQMAKYNWIHKDRVFLLREQVNLSNYTADELGHIATMMTDWIEEFRRSRTSEDEEE